MYYRLNISRFDNPEVRNILTQEDPQVLYYINTRNIM